MNADVCDDTMNDGEHCWIFELLLHYFLVVVEVLSYLLAMIA